MFALRRAPQVLGVTRRGAFLSAQSVRPSFYSTSKDSETMSAEKTRVAVVTGAARGIGRAIALRLAADGLDVALDDIPVNASLLKGVREEIIAMGRRSMCVLSDVSKEDEVERLMERTVDELGSVDVMVANAGVGSTFQTIMDADIGMWEQLYSVNVRGVVLCYKHAAIQMVKQGTGGRIIGASSVCGRRGFAGLGAYCISKASVLSITQTAALELASQGITVNAYAPGTIETSMTTFPEDEQLGAPVAFVKQAMRIPEAATGQPDDIANLVSYLASPGSRFVTGQTISVDSGLHFH